MNSDPVIEEVRSARRKISAVYGHDVRKMVADHMKRQELYSDRLITLEQIQSQRKPSRRPGRKSRIPA